jgi:hypothetical protein
MAQLINGPKRWKQFIKSSTDLVQDPTYLTFDLDFFPAPQDHPTGDGLYFDSLFRTELNTAQATNSYVEWPAYQWLSKYGSNHSSEAATHLQAAINILVELQSSPWYFQSVSGIDQLWKSSSRVKEGDKKIELTIGCLDSIKQPVLRLADHYRSAIYDFNMLKYALPDNLRYFNMDIRIFEIRDINDRQNSLDASGTTQNLPFKGHPYLEDGLHQMKYRLHMCEFDFTDIFGGPTNSELKAYTQDKPFETSFKIRAGWSTETTEASTESDYHSLGIFTGVMESLEGRANRFLQSAVSFPQRIIGNVTNRVQTTLENRVLGNVYNRVNEVGNANSLFGGTRQSPIGPSNLGGQVYSDRNTTDEYKQNLVKSSNLNKNVYDK